LPSAHDRALWALAVLLSLLLLIAPALWNGFALLQYDTGGYLARWYEGYLVPSRAVLYGLMLTASAALAFWPLLLVQSALTVWIVALVLRTHGFGGRPLVLLAVIATLSVCTTLPWLTAILLTDIFCGLGVLAFYLLLMRAEILGGGERIGLIALVAVAAATHNATLAVLGALIVAAALLRLVDRERLRVADIGRGGVALMLGAAMVFAADAVVAKRLAWTPGGFALSFGRMLQDGIVKKYLEAHCPDRTLQLCAYKDQLPTNADVWFWGSPLFDRLGRFAGLGPEMERIAVASVIEFPLLQIETALADTAEQLVAVHTGEGVVHWVWHTYFIVQHYTPRLVPAMWAARQQRGEISFAAINTFQYPLALASMALLPLVGFAAARRMLPREIGEFAAAMSVAVLANAFVCGAMSNPHDRYGARIVWLGSFAALTALLRLAESRRMARSELNSLERVHIAQTFR